MPCGTEPLRRCVTRAVQISVLGQLTFSGDFLDMTHVGQLDVKLVAQANLKVMLVPDNQLQRFKELEAQRSGGAVHYYGVTTI